MSQNSLPWVSVIMNCLNGSKYLREAVDSVYAQTFKDWEIIFWDNASTDSSADIAKSYDSRVKYFCSKSTVSLGKARNFAFEKAEGKYIAFLDCDDIWLPQKLEKQIHLLERDPSLCMVFSDSLFMDEKGSVLGSAFKRCPPPPPGSMFTDILTKPNFIPCLTAVVRRSVMEDAGGFNPDLYYDEEYDLFLRMARVNPISYVSEPLAQYRLHGQNMSGLGSLGTTREAIWIIKNMVCHVGFLEWKHRWAVRRRLTALYAKLLFQVVRQAVFRVPFVF